MSRSQPVRRQPCSACPYRCDVPSGVWDHDEYDKLRPFDRERMAQPPSGFACHATPDHWCHGWAVVGVDKVPHGRDLLALRLGLIDGPIPDETIPLFNSHSEAADHGQAEVDAPSAEALEVMAALQRKHPRLRSEAAS